MCALHAQALGFFPPRHMLRDTAADVRRLLSRAGRPRKLRRITWEFLGMVIQDADGGHSPHEDARAALGLYHRYREEFEARAALLASRAAGKAAVEDADEAAWAALAAEAEPEGTTSEKPPRHRQPGRSKEE